MSVLARVRRSLHRGGPDRTTPVTDATADPDRPAERPVAAARLREMATVRAEIVSTEASPAGTTPTFTARVQDGTGSLDLLWLGRRAVGAVVPGAMVRATGRVCDRGGVATIFNPTYELLPARERPRAAATDRRTTA